MSSLSIKISSSSKQYINYRDIKNNSSSDDDTSDDDTSDEEYNTRPNIKSVNKNLIANAAEKRFVGTPKIIGSLTNSNKKKKKPIPAAVKRIVWNKCIGEHIGKSKCICCNITDITQLSFHCGHIISEANGGKIEVPNLRPICQNCNSSMGKMNMDEFIKKYKL